MSAPYPTMAPFCGSLASVVSLIGRAGRSSESERERKSQLTWLISASSVTIERLKEKKSEAANNNETRQDKLLCLASLFATLES